ncbi:MAG: hypothetical protein J6X28_03005 [Bacilli bacterium]|nr:hypothetical protein [Bacilli bacterium]
MSDGLIVQAGGMSQDGKSTIDSSEDFLGEIHKLESNTHELLSIWNGPAATAYKGSFEGKTAELMDFKQRLTQRGENIVTSAKILSDNEDDLASAGSHLF